MDIIKTIGLTHEYVRKDEDDTVRSSERALDDISLDIEEGSFVAILGRNGSGKSTLARHFNALLKPTEGTVWVNGYDTKDDGNLLKIRKSAGMVFQNPDNQIIADVVEEDVAFGPENIGIPGSEIWERVAESLDKTGMTAWRFSSPDKLSGGQKQRVAIAGIMAMQPACMILDEATSMLDPEGRREVLNAVHELNIKEKVTIILITHNMDEAAGADRVIVLDGGRIVMDGSPECVFSDVEKLHENGLEAPQAAELARELKNRGMPLPDGIISREALVEAIDALMKAPGEGTVCR